MRKVLSLFIYILCSVFILSSVSITPFSIYADYLPSAPFVGVNYYIESYDNEYIPSLSSGSSSLSLSGNQTNTLLVQHTTNGVTYVTSNYSQGAVSGNGGYISLTGSINLSSSLTNTQVVKRIVHVDIILDDYYMGYINARVTFGNTNMFSQSLAVNGNIVSFSFGDSNTSFDPKVTVGFIDLTDFSLVKNNNNERWQFPIESLTFNKFLFQQNYNMVGLNKYNEYYMPIFDIPSNNNVISLPNGSLETDFVVIFGVNQNIWDVGSFERFFSYTNVTIKHFEFIQRINQPSYTIVKVIFNRSEGYVDSPFIITNRQLLITPIYVNDVNNTHISTDFALLFGLSNPLLDDLDIIANGTTSSNQSSSAADSSNSQLNNEISNYNQVEQQLTGDFQSNLNAINVDSPLNILGSGFVQSANWVRTQFDTLTNNNPFGSLLTFSLILGVGLLIIGKVFG